MLFFECFFDIYNIFLSFNCFSDLSDKKKFGWRNIESRLLLTSFFPFFLNVIFYF